MLVFKRAKTLNKLSELAELVNKSAVTLREITLDWSRLRDGASRMEELEQEADEKVHQISDDIDRFFILPLDKEDLSRLTDSLDDVVDQIEQVSNRLKIYNIPETNADLQAFSLLIVQATEQINLGVRLIADRKMQSFEFGACFEKLESLEGAADRLHRALLEKIMRPDGPAIQDGLLSVIKWKEIFQTLEDTLDRCEDIAVIFSRLKTKYK